MEEKCTDFKLIDCVRIHISKENKKINKKHLRKKRYLFKKIKETKTISKNI